MISKKSLMEVNEIVSNTRKAFQAAFQSLKWMTGSVRETALRKIMTMRHHIGAVGALPDSAYVEKYYGKCIAFKSCGTPACLKSESDRDGDFSLVAPLWLVVDEVNFLTIPACLRPKFSDVASK